MTTFSFGRDQSIYATVGSGMLSGKLPYRDLWDFKPPGIFYVFAAAEALFGHNMAAPRILEAIGLLGMALAMVALSRRWFGATLPGLFGAVIASTVHLQLDFWHSGQPETFGGMLTIFALLCASLDVRGARRHWCWALSGGLLGAAALMKPPLGGAAIVLAAYLTRAHLAGSRRDTLVGLFAMGLGASLPFAACIGWFWARGGLGAMLWTLRDYVPGYTALGWQGEHHALEMFYYAAVEALTKFSAWISLGIAALFLLPRHSLRELEHVLLLLGCAIVHVTGVALQAKFFQYHYGATIPLLALAAGLGWYKLWTRAWAKRPWPAVGLLLAATVALMMRKPIHDVPGTVLERSWARVQFLLRRSPFDTRQKLDEALHKAADYDLASNHRVAAWVAAHSLPTDFVLVWGFEPYVYWYSGRRPATRFIYNVAQRSHWQTETSQSLFIDEVRARNPRLIIVQHNDVFPGVTGFFTDSFADLPRFAALDGYVRERYSFVLTIDDFDVLERRP
ncbi:MAG: glycosyltransferase family 39 protein [Polyangiaceae bacterium]